MWFILPTVEYIIVLHFPKGFTEVPLPIYRMNSVLVLKDELIYPVYLQDKLYDRHFFTK